MRSEVVTGAVRLASVPCFHAPLRALRSGTLTRLGKSTQKGCLGIGGPSDFRLRPDPVFGWPGAMERSLPCLSRIQ